jgi:alpha-beta hydrolase superfamily lysophospholipase
MTRPRTIALCVAGLALLGIFLALSDTLGGLRPVNDTRVSKPSVSSAGSQPVSDNFTEDFPDNPSIGWYKSVKPGELNGVALVIHGLNLRPDRMGPIINNLTRSGIDVLGVSLRGHGDNYAHHDDVDSDSARLESFKNVSFPLWINEAYLAYLQVQKRAQQQNIPVFLTAFSVGGLIGLDLLASHPDVQFDKIVLFAPALSLRATIYLERALSPFPSLVIPSLADDSYLANKKGTPIAAYNALFETLYHFEDNAGTKLNVPTLIFIDEQDEFIPLWGLKKLVEEHNLDQWKFYIVQKEKVMGAGTFHHHIIDAASTGENVWQDMMAATTMHLLGDKAK